VILTGPVIVTEDGAETGENVALTAQALFGIENV
jgi:hypothetical protein